MKSESCSPFCSSMLRLGSAWQARQLWLLTPGCSCWAQARNAARATAPGQRRPKNRPPTRHARFRAVGELGGRDDPARQKAGEEEREPLDEPGGDQDAQAKEQEPVGELLLEVVLAEAGLGLAQIEQVAQHAGSVAYILPGRQHGSRA